MAVRGKNHRISSFGVLAVWLAAASCGGTSAPAPDARRVACDPRRLDACERAIAAALTGRTLTRDLVASYATARASRSTEDPWASGWRELTAGAPSTVALVVEGDAAPAATAAAAKLGARARLIQLPALPRPEVMSEGELLLAFAEAASVRHVIHVDDAQAAGPGARRAVFQIFPHDPLEPLVMGLAPITRDDASLTRITEDVELAGSIHKAVDLASVFDYVAAARETDHLQALVARRTDPSEPLLRARYVLQALAGSGLTLDPAPAADPPAGAAAAQPTPAAIEAPPSPMDTPYGDYLRIRTAKDERAAWGVRGSSVLRGVAPDRRDVVASTFAPANLCAVIGVPPMSGVRDLQFSGRLSSSLTRNAAGPASDGQLMVPEWIGRYDAFVRLVEQTRSFWAYGPNVLAQRGQVHGLQPAGTTTYRKVTELGLAHLAALLKLEQAFPDRYPALAQLGLVYAPGVLADDRLREEVVKLSEAVVADKIARAPDAGGLFEGVLTGVFAGMSYPPAIQPAHYVALQGAFTAKLRGDLTRRTGWGVAGLYAADAIFRLLSDQKADLAATAAQIARALEQDPALPMPSLGPLAVSAAHYAALAADKKLDPEQKPERWGPERRAAREALKEAIAGLGPKGEAPSNVLEDVTTLTDGCIATLALIASERDPSAPAAPAGGAAGTAKSAPAACADTNAGPSPAVRRAVAKLGDVRLRILGHPRFKTAGGAWARRTRLLVTLLSDAIDIIGKRGPQPVFAITRQDGERHLIEALSDWDEKELADALGGIYSLVRDFMVTRSGERYLANSGQPLRRVFGGLRAFFSGSGPATAGGGKGGVALLDALASMAPAKSGAFQSEDASALMIAYATTFYERKQPDQGDLLLLAALTLSATAHKPPPKEAIELAAKHTSRVEWALRFLSELAAARRGVAPDPSVYASSMRTATDDECAAPQVDAVIGVMDAVKGFLGTDRKGARAGLDRVLEGADARGLAVPKMTFRYEEKTAKKVFAFSLDVSTGGGLLENPNSVQIGLGVRTGGEPEGKMTLSLAPQDSPQATEQTVRYYIHAAALAAAYHFIEGDPEHATAAARRAIGAVVQGVRLGDRAMIAPSGAPWAVDARALLAIDAQLAAEAGLPLVAGDLFTIVRATLGADTTDATVDEILNPLPLGLAGVPEAQAIADRTRKSLRLLAGPLPCTDAKVDASVYEEATCETYPLAVALRVADIVKKMPRLRKSAESASGKCAVLRSLDTFLDSADRGAYDPDAFVRAVEALRTDGRLYDAAVLLTRQRHESHCNPALVAAARSLGRSTMLGPVLTNDLLSVAVNCSLADPDKAMEDDILVLDADTRKMADPMRNFRLALFVAELGERTGRWGPLGRLTAQPDFVSRWARQSSTATAAALVLDHAAAILNGRAIEREKSAGTIKLICETYPPQGYAELCASLKELRDPASKTAEARTEAARKAIKSLIVSTTSPPPAQP
jgi:hypothetical protein